MSFTFRPLALATLALVAHAPFAHGQSATTGGRSTFGMYCATCHGQTAKGDGPMAAVLTKRPADLTQISRRNGGTFPSEVIAKVIDGRTPVKGHGGGEMPVWGDAFSRSADPTPVAERIARVVAYLETVQTGVDGR